MNPAPPSPPRRSIGKILALVMLAIVATLVITVGGCFVVLWALN